MNRPAPRELRVIRKATVSPHMLRVTLGGEGMATFPPNQAGGYVKLVFPRGDAARPLLRTYTIRAQRDAEIDLDMVVHTDGGPASSWAVGCREGDRVLVGGPGPRQLIEPTGDWFVFAGDMAALPAISVNLEQLRRDARGYAIIEAVSGDDIQLLDAPEHVCVQWLINPRPGTDSLGLARRVRSVEWLPGRPSIWAAGELGSMRALRSFLRERPSVERERIYVSSYWKLGSDEEQHREIKRADAESADLGQRLA